MSNINDGEHAGDDLISTDDKYANSKMLVSTLMATTTMMVPNISDDGIYTDDCTSSIDDKDTDSKTTMTTAMMVPMISGGKYTDKHLIPIDDEYANSKKTTTTTMAVPKRSDDQYTLLVVKRSLTNKVMMIS